MLRLLLALNWLLIVAGDVELNPGPVPPGITELLPTVDASVLTEKDICDVFDEVQSLAGRWRGMCIRLGLLSSDVDTIATMHPHNPMDCLMEVVSKWLKMSYNTHKHGLPTWQKLVAAVADSIGGANPALAKQMAENHQDKAHIAGETGDPKTSSDSSLEVTKYMQYLRGRYQKQIPTVLTLQWPPPPTRKVLHLAMIQGKHTQYGSSDEDIIKLTLQGNIKDILRQKTPIELTDIFHNAKAEREVILFEGAPGAGKSTLAWHICQQWGAGKLFQNFQTVIFIQLRDPAIQSAKSVEDILPAAARRQAEKVTAELIASSGKDVLFVMDGWDELPLDLHTNSIFHKLIAFPETLNLHFSTVIVTSRPVAAGDLYQYRTITSRIEILGFTPTEIKGYFIEALEGNSRAIQKLQDELKERPMIEASCYLPLNAAIVTHLFLAQNQNLPTTLHGVFASLVICCLIRHMTKERQETCFSFSSLDKLPSCLQEPFNNICTLAYHGIMENKATFSAGDLERFKLPQELNALGLLQGIHSFTSFQKSITYNFLHLSIQELLASLHISKLPDDEEVKIFKKLFSQPQFAAVFQFYTAFTKLETEEVRVMVANIVQKKEKSQLVHLFSGLYEAQNLSLCQFMESQLYGKLILTATSLSPVDCLCVGYFLCTVSGKFIVALQYCSLNCNRISFLVKEFSKCNRSSGKYKTTATDVGVQGSAELHLYLGNNRILCKGAKAIGEILKVNQSLTTLDLGNNKIADDGARTLGEALRVNQTLTILDVTNNEITADGACTLGEALKLNQSLTTLNLAYNTMKANGAQALGEALNVNQSLRTLSLGENGIGNIGAAAIAEGLSRNTSLDELRLWDNDITDDGAVALARALNVNHSLKTLDLDSNQIKEDGAKALAEALKVNQSLTILDLQSNKIAVEGIKALGEALRVNLSLTTLRVQNVGISSEMQQSLLMKFQGRVDFSPVIKLF